MRGWGTIVNMGTVLLGTAVGLRLGGGLPERFAQTIRHALGLCTMFIGIGGTCAELLYVDNGGLSTRYTMLLVLSMLLGTLIGEAIDIERQLERFGNWCRVRLVRGATTQDTRFVEGFVTTSLLFCVGAMAIVGALEDGLNGNPSILITKAILDGVAAMIFAASMGKGVYLSALTVGLYQGAITLLAGLLRPLLNEVLISQMSCVGSVLIFAIGVRMLLDKEIKIGNLLPAMLMPPVFYLLGALFPILRSL